MEEYNVLQKDFKEDPQYRKALQLFKEQFLPVHSRDRFTIEQVFTFFGCKSLKEHVIHKRILGDVLRNLAHTNKGRGRLLEQIGKYYRFINRNLDVIDLANIKRGNVLQIMWPWGIEDGSSFGFEESIQIYPNDLIVIAGEGQRGKTAFCLNFMAANIDQFANKCYYFTSEYKDGFKIIDRLDKFYWADLYDENKKPRFVLAKQSEYWQDVIQSGCLNIIDWIRLDDEPWKIRAMLDKIIEPLDGGIALAAQQKRTYKEYGEGGEGAKDLASVYFLISYNEKLSSNILKVEKVKTPGETDPNFKMFRFKIVENGSQFHAIHEVAKCKKCNQKGYVYGKECDACGGSGLVDLYRQPEF